MKLKHRPKRRDSRLRRLQDLPPRPPLKLNRSVWKPKKLNDKDWKQKLKLKKNVLRQKRQKGSA